MTATSELRTYTHNFVRATAFYIGNRFVAKNFPYYIRHTYVRKILKIHLGIDSSIAMGVFITGNNIRIGNNTVINRFTYLDGRAELQIGNNVNISHYTLIQTLTHDPQNPHFIAIEKPVHIHDHVWIGARVLICPGVTIGEGAVVGAGSVVTKNVEPYSIVAGNPAKKIKERSTNLNYKSRYFPFYDTDIQPK